MSHAWVPTNTGPGLELHKTPSDHEMGLQSPTQGPISSAHASDYSGQPPHEAIMLLGGVIGPMALEML